MLIWSYWPAPQGGAERQCRMISSALDDKGVEPIIVTARLSYAAERRQHDKNTMIERLGLLLPVILGCGDLLRQLLEPLFVLSKKILKKYNGNSSRYYEIDKKYAFWAGLPSVWLSRLLFIIHFLVWGASKKKDFDVIHVHETGWLGAVGVLAGKVWDKPVVCKAATSPPFPIIGWDVPFSFLFRKLQKKSDIIVLNRYAQDSLINSGFPIERISVIPNAVSLPRLPASPAQSNVVLYVGNLSQGVYIKAFDVLFEAWSLAVKRNPSIRLVVAGGGNSSEMKEYVRSLGCEESVQFSGFVENTEQLYLQAGLLVLPSRIEGMSNALLEALSYGLPVIASDILANQAVLEQSDCGLLVEVGNSQALSEAIVQLMSDNEKRGNMGTLAREWVKEHYHVEKVSHRLVSLYQQRSDEKSST